MGLLLPTAGQWLTSTMSHFSFTTRKQRGHLHHSRWRHFTIPYRGCGGRSGPLGASKHSLGGTYWVGKFIDHSHKKNSLWKWSGRLWWWLTFVFPLLAGADPASSQSWEGLVCWERGMQPCRLCARTCKETWRVGLLPQWHLRDSWRTSFNQLCYHEVSVRGPGICCQREAQRLISRGLLKGDGEVSTSKGERAFFCLARRPC